LDLVIILIFSFGAWAGYRDGLITTAARIAALIISIIFAGLAQGVVFNFLVNTPLYDLLSETISNTMGFYQVPLFGEFLSRQATILALTIISYLFVFLILYITLRICINLLDSLIEKISFIGFVNSILGLLIGLIKSLLFVWLSLIVILLFYEPSYFGLAMWLAERNLVLYFILG
ncbi:MAG: CvpA family protein, partial [Defluviitaleaceae bacterium]|nr:CvpA family protein [Defluviitaleaceae bacterium]